ncbi:MAG: hypothetical protein A2V63_07710 [Candidatus Eisenbacteria bacterium RBG_19FT_COMBO_70_11]|nr:MAG: hypothetical protein A2V63_07710 [Candidatus Eisenbacteria bacterium RBG_19FT_COMBO_70_11]
MGASASFLAGRFPAPLLAGALILLTAPGPSAAERHSANRAEATTIHILGEFNGWDTSLWTTDPGMTHVGNSWVGNFSVTPWFVAQGYQQFKLVTDRAWDLPPDYCLCPDRLNEYTTLSGPLCLVPYGLNAQMYADLPGRYEMVLDETLMRYSARLIEPFTAAITGLVRFNTAFMPLPAAEVLVSASGTTLTLARAFSDPVTGAFRVEGLDGGSYDLTVSATGYLPRTVTGVGVAAGGTTNAGVIALDRGCTSAWTAIQVVGDFNGWNTAVPSMTQINACQWEQAVHVVAGCYYMKFRTNNVWGNDYGTCAVQDPGCGVPLSGSVCVVNGENALGKINFPVTEDYLFRLDEAQNTYSIQPLATPAARRTWGSLKVRYR